MAVLLEFFKRVNANSGAVRSRLKLLARLLGNSPDFFLPVEEVHHLCSIISSKMISLSDRREAPIKLGIKEFISSWHHHRGRILFCGPSDIGSFTGGPLDPERQADAFASDLILPGYLVRPVIAKFKKVTLAYARAILEEFRASMTATLLRILNENSFPILVVCHGKDRRRWFRRAEMVPQWWFPREDLDPDTFAFEILHNAAREDSFPRKNGAGAWFEFRHVDHYEIQEQSFPLPNDEVLTVLTIPEEGLG